jgi:hypothetical protein
MSAHHHALLSRCALGSIEEPIEERRKGRTRAPVRGAARSVTRRLKPRPRRARSRHARIRQHSVECTRYHLWMQRTDVVEVTRPRSGPHGTGPHPLQLALLLWYVPLASAWQTTSRVAIAALRGQHTTAPLPRHLADVGIGRRRRVVADVKKVGAHRVRRECVALDKVHQSALKNEQRRRQLHQIVGRVPGDPRMHSDVTLRVRVSENVREGAHWKRLKSWVPSRAHVCV